MKFSAATSAVVTPCNTAGARIPKSSALPMIAIMSRFFSGICHHGISTVCHARLTPRTRAWKNRSDPQSRMTSETMLMPPRAASSFFTVSRNPRLLRVAHRQDGLDEADDLFRADQRGAEGQQKRDEREQRKEHIIRKGRRALLALDLAVNAEGQDERAPDACPGFPQKVPHDRATMGKNMPPVKSKSAESPPRSA